MRSVRTSHARAVVPTHRRICCIRATPGNGLQRLLPRLQVSQGKRRSHSTLNALCFVSLARRRHDVTKVIDAGCERTGTRDIYRGNRTQFSRTAEALLPAEGAWKLGGGASLVKHQFKIFSGSFWLLFRPNLHGSGVQVPAPAGGWRRLRERAGSSSESA